MRPSTFTSLALGASAMVCALSAPLAASADTKWLVNATFTDGTTLTGYFTYDVYGYVYHWNLVTQPGSGLSGTDYTTGGSTYSYSSEVVFDAAGYSQELNLFTTKPLTAGSVGNSFTSASYECQYSSLCSFPIGGDIRYLDVAESSITYVPEPTAWALMLLGVAGVGWAARRRAASVPAAAH